MTKRPATVAAFLALVLLLGAATASAATRNATIRVTGMT